LQSFYVDFFLFYREAYLNDVKHLLESHYDEKQFFNQIGFHKAKNSLEQLLTTKYQLALKPTLATLEDLCRKTEAELISISKEMQTNDTTQLKMKASSYVQVNRRLRLTAISDTSRRPSQL